jgi:hypothetical protein
MADNDTPQTLPANFFDNKKKAGSAPPKTLPPDFFAKKAQTPDPTKPDPTAITAGNPILSAKATGFVPGHPYGGGGREVTGTPEQITDLQKTQQGVAETGAASAATAGLGSAPGMLGMLFRALAAGGAAGATHAGTEAATTGKPDLKGSAQTAAGYGLAEGGGELALKGAGKVASKLFPKVDPLAKINKLLGVGPKEIVPGRVPASLEEFAANPARGASKAGLEEKTLAKMNPLERNSAIMKAKDAAGQQLEQVLQKATSAGKTVDIYPTLDKVFDGIPDKKVAKEAENQLIQILKNKNLDKMSLDKLTPMQAREIQRGLDAFTGNEEIVDQLRRGIREATRKSVPESAEADQHYWDLANAAKGTQKLVKKYATTVPENKLRKWLIRGAMTGAGAGAGYEAGKLWKSTPVP